MRMLTALPAHIESRSSLPGLTWSSPIGANLRRIISLSVVIVRACGRSSKHGTSHLARLYPQSAVQGLLGAPLKAGHDDERFVARLKLAPIWSSPRMTRRGLAQFERNSL